MGRNLLSITAAPLLLLLLYISACSATVYNVGDSSGWDISTDLDSWAKDKTFFTGDTLWFQYSQYHSVNEVTEKNYRNCNMSNAIQSASNGNTSFVLTEAGDRYFVCGNRLHCLGGMKLHAHVINNQTESPVGAPQPQPEAGGSPPGSKSTGPSSSASFTSDDAHLLPFLGLYVITLMFLV